MTPLLFSLLFFFTAPLVSPSTKFFPKDQVESTPSTKSTKFTPSPTSTTLIPSTKVTYKDQVKFTPSDQATVLEAAFGVVNGSQGRSNLASLSSHRDLLSARLSSLLIKQGWLPARALAKAVSLGLDLASLDTNTTSDGGVGVIRVRGPVTACHAQPSCLDMACSRCFDPLTSMHGDCGLLSFFKCSPLLPDVCLPWTCATQSTPTSPLPSPALRNFLPRRAGCSSGRLPSDNLQLVDGTSLPSSVHLTGLGLTMNALTSCSEEQVCWDPNCSLCYDPLEQEHSTCPQLSVPSCSSLPASCQPFYCWPVPSSVKQTSPVILRDYQRGVGGDC